MAGEEPLNLIPNESLKLDTKSIRLSTVTCMNKMTSWCSTRGLGRSITMHHVTVRWACVVIIGLNLIPTVRWDGTSYRVLPRRNTAPGVLTPLSCWTAVCRAQCCWHMCQSQGPPAPQWQKAAPPAWPRSDACHPTRAPGRSRTVATQGISSAGFPSCKSPPEGGDGGGLVNM